MPTVKVRALKTAYFDLLAPKVVLHSPVLHSPFAGRETVAPLLGLLRACFTETTYTDELSATNVLGLVFRAKIAGLQAEGIQLLRFDREGRIIDFTAMLRPIRAAMALSEAMGPQIQKLPDGTYGVKPKGE